MASYPSNIKTFPTLVDMVDSVLAAHQNERGDEITAIETELGTNPKGSAASVKARIEDIEESAITNLTGDVTASGPGSVAATISNNAVTLAKMADMATASLLGRNSAGSGDPEVLSAAAVRLIIGAREKLTANRTYYVRTDGDDGNTGLVDSAAGAFKTIQKAVDTIANTLDIAGYTVTVQVRDGTYTGAVNLKNVVGFAIAGNLVIQGNSGTPANVIISTTSADCFNANGLNVTWDIKDMKLQTTTSGSCLKAAVSSVIRFSNIVFGATANYHINAENGGSIVCIGNYSISGNAFIHMISGGNGYLQIAGVTVTFLASVAFSYFAYSTFMGFLNAYSITFSLGAYSVTGTRYYASVNSAIQTNGGGANYFPGDAPGGTAAGGQYV